jgi:N-acetylglucosaminyldiphosphoundecaprenol N-acetyl-beta-D-mannosaminyltransferase
VDILRRVCRDPESRAYVESASLIVADGKPLIWASQLAGNPLPARVPGSDLIWSLSAALAEQNRSVYLMGGTPGTAGRAEQVMRSRFPRLRIAGHLSPPIGFDTRPDQFEAACATVVAARPDLVFVGLGFPKQERVIARLRPLLPNSWFLGCGAAIGFVAGVNQRAPSWMQQAGLEWAHRLANEPARLMRRYLVHDLPFALALLAASARARLRRGRAGAPAGELSIAPDWPAVSGPGAGPHGSRTTPAIWTTPGTQTGTTIRPARPPRPNPSALSGPLPGDGSGPRLPIEAGEPR